MKKRIVKSCFIVIISIFMIRLKTRCVNNLEQQQIFFLSLNVAFGNEK